MQNKNEELEKILDDISQEALLTDYWYYQGLKRREVFVTGIIDEQLINKVIMPLKVMEEEDPTKPIKIYLNTNGGSVWDAAPLLNILDNIKCPTTIIVLGYALSMGIYILMAGHNNPNVKAVCNPFSIGLIHPGSVYLEGDARKVKEIQRINDTIDEKLKDFVLSHSKITEDLYEEKSGDEWYLTADDLLKYGIVQEIL